MGAEGVPFLRLPLLEDAEVGSIDGHQAVVAFVVVEPTIEVDLWFCEGGGESNRGVVRWRWKCPRWRGGASTIMSSADDTNHVDNEGSVAARLTKNRNKNKKKY